MTTHRTASQIRQAVIEDTIKGTLTMTCDRPCITVRGMMVHPGTVVTYLDRVSAKAVRVRMEDGSEEIVNPTCFPELR